mmetsp:Transcript_49274/g.92381  ORF Transcript_49274/g.92381 Transcript_49274/m.92381 type:complete len:127 (+) Transcript_49274:818-1198(+)
MALLMGTLFNLGCTLSASFFFRRWSWVKSMRPSAICLKASSGSRMLPSEADFFSLVPELSGRRVALKEVVFFSVLSRRLVLSVIIVHEVSRDGCDGSAMALLISPGLVAEGIPGSPPRAIFQTSPI